MPWISPRMNQWSLHTRCIRNVWYFRKELKKYFKKNPDEINFNANLWKWLYLWFDSVYRYRMTEQARIKNPFGPIGTTPTFQTRRNPVHFNAWLDYTSKKVFGYRLVSLYGNNAIVFQKWVKGVRDQAENICHLTEKDWNIYVANEEIRWCPVRKDWFFSNCFSAVRTYAEDGSHKIILVANPIIFSCPVCGLNHLDAPQNKVKNPYTKQFTCPKCKDERPSNPPQTQQSIYGDYHSHYRSGWKFFPCYLPNDETVPMGIELEMQTKDKATEFNPREVAWQMYQHQLQANPKWNLFYCERDGSIGEYGLEMITQPMTQELHNQFWEHMLPMIRTKFSGWNTQKRHPGGQYGIHITFDSQLYGQLNMARLAKFLENKNNQVFVQGIAQRGMLYGAGTHIAQDTKKVSQVFKYDQGKLLGSQARNQCLNLKGPKGLCEVRMFRSTLNTTSFFKNLEFLWAFRQWAGETPWNTNYTAFLLWLITKPILYGKYPHLYEYMCHKIFPVDNPRWDTTNRSSGSFTELVERLKKGQKDLFETFSPENSDYLS